MSSLDKLADEIATLALHIDTATHRMLACIRQFDEENGWYAQGAASCAHWLSWRIGLDLATAREKVRVARALGKLPAIDEAFAAGKLSYAKVRAVSRVASPENEARLLAEQHGLDLGPDANLPLWDGTRPDHDLAVAGLLAGAWYLAAMIRADPMKHRHPCW